MPRIPDVHLASVVFIYPSEAAAHEGAQVGGTGFVVNYPSGVGPWRIRYVVTNLHVIDAGGHWLRLNHPGGTSIVHLPPERWIAGPDGDDFAVALLPLPSHVQPYELALDVLAVTREMASELNVGPGDEIYMVGRLLSHGGRSTNNPTARFGSIALMPSVDEPVLDGRGREVAAYLVEMRSHAGFSGSPVFVLIPQWSFRGVIGDTSREDNQTKFRLLGIDTGHKIDSLKVLERDRGGTVTMRSDLAAEHPTDVAIVAPMWKVTDLLVRDDIAEERRRLGTELDAMRSDTAISAVAE